MSISSSNNALNVSHPDSQSHYPPKLHLNTLGSISEEEDNPLMNTDINQWPSSILAERTFESSAANKTTSASTVESSAADKIEQTPTAESANATTVENEAEIAVISAAGPSGIKPTAENRSRSKT